MTNPTPGESEEAFSDDLLRATRAERAGDERPMDAITARMEAIEATGEQFFPGSRGGVQFEYFGESESLVGWTERERDARTPVRFEDRACGYRVGLSNSGDPVTLDTECREMREHCRDVTWRTRHVRAG